MATKSVSARLILSALNDAGEQSAKDFDESLILSAFTDLTPGRRIQLAAGAVDQAMTFTACIGLLIFSHDTPFKLRLAAAQAQLDNVRSFFVFCDDKDDAAHTTSVLLSGNTVTPSDVEVWVIEKP